MALSELAQTIQNQVIADWQHVETLDMPESVSGKGIVYGNFYDRYLRERLEAAIAYELLTAGNALVLRTDEYDFPLDVPEGKLTPREKV